MKFKLFITSLSLFSAVSYADENPKNVELDEVTVTASRMGLTLKQVPQKIEIIDARNLEAFPHENVAEALKRITNLDIIQYPGALATVGMRGLPPTTHNRSYTLILIDGKPAGTNNLATIPSDFIERIEVVKGPYSVLYGSDAMGGVINVITKSPSKIATGKVGVSMGNFGQTNISAGVSGEILPKLGIAFNYSRREQNRDYRIGDANLLHHSEKDKLILDEKSFGDVMENTQFQINQLNGKLQYRINDLWNVSLLSVLTISNDIETPGNYWHSNGMSKKDIDRTANYLDINRKSLNNELIISPYLTNQKEANYDNNTDSSFVKSRERIQQYGVKIGNTHVWGNLRGMLGADYDGYRVSSEKFSKKAVPTTPLRPDNHRNAISAFGQLAYTWNNLFVNAGVRYNYIAYTLEANEMLNSAKKSEHYTHVNPSLGLNYQLLPELRLHASAGNAFYVPDAYKMAGIYKIGKKIYVGNKDLKPESATSYDVGINYDLGEYINVDATYFQSFYKNKIVNDTSKKDTTSYKNATDGMMNGIEILLTSNLAALWNAPYRLELQGGMTHYFNTEFKEKATNEAGQSVEVTKDMLYIRRTTANLGIKFDNNRGFVARVNGRYIGHRLENDYMGNLRPALTEADYYNKGGYVASNKILEHPANLIFDLSAHYLIRSKYKVGFSITNLLDENYTEKDGYNMPGRSIMGHFSYHF